MIRFTILGQPCSKSNRSRIITLGGHASLVKSKEAIAYERAALLQIPAPARQRLEGPVRVTIRIWYASERPDLDESLLLDCLQDRWNKRTLPPKTVGSIFGAPVDDGRVLAQAGVYRNDRQVREKHVYHAIDKRNPRAEIEVEAMQAQQPELALVQRAIDPFAECEA